MKPKPLTSPQIQKPLTFRQQILRFSLIFCILSIAGLGASGLLGWIHTSPDSYTQWALVGMIIFGVLGALVIWRSGGEVIHVLKRDHPDKTIKNQSLTTQKRYWQRQLWTGPKNAVFLLMFTWVSMQTTNEPPALLRAVSPLICLYFIGLIIRISQCLIQLRKIDQQPGSRNS